MELPVLKQSPVTFKSDTHQYFLNGKELQGITQTLVKRAFPDTYKCPENYTEEQWREILDNAAAKGSNMHETIELYDELGVVSDLPELQSYINIKEANGLTVLATEYIVSDEEQYATAIDKVFITPEGKIILVDFKRTSQLHIDNVACQLSICKYFFEKQNPELEVDDICVMWLRDDKSRFERLIPWAEESLMMLFDCEKENKTFDLQKAYGDFPAKFAEVEEEVARLEMAVKAAQERQKELKQGLYNLMFKNNIKSWTGSRIKLTRVLPTIKTTFDSKKLKKEMPDIYEKFTSTSETAGSLRITIKK